MMDAQGKETAPGQKGWLQLLLWVFVLLTLYVTGALVTNGIAQFLQAWSLHSWPTTDGVLMDGSVAEQTNLQTQSRVFKAVIRYSYSVGGSGYVSDQWSPGGSPVALGEKQVVQRLQQLRQQGHLTVHYNPANPSQAYLSVDIDDGYLFLVWGLGLLLMIVPTVAGGLISSWLDANFASRFESSSGQGRLPRAWRRFGIDDNPSLLKLTLSRRRWVSRFAAVGLALVVAGIPGFLTYDGILPRGQWTWALAVAMAGGALYWRIRRSNFRSYSFDADKREVFESKRDKEPHLFATFDEIECVELLENPYARGLTLGRTRMEIPICSDGAPYRLTADLSDLPIRVVDALAERLAGLVGVELSRPQPLPADGPEAGEPPAEQVAAVSETPTDT